ncbi:MAG: putative toxin-antitoxin system toxin component, PIN family [Saprospiraceae bacterium]
MRLVFDNNIWISFAIGNHMKDIPAILLRPDIELFACRELIEEFERVCQYEKIKHHLKPERLVSTIELIHIKASIAEITNRLADFSDPKDNYLLDLCAEVAADFLVTGDKRLLLLNVNRTTKIITYNELRDLLGIKG